jgi:hypothetical protein
MNILQGFEKINEVMITSLEREITTDGLLEDVESFFPCYYEDGTINEPVLWLTQHPSRANRQADISMTLEITTPFQISCGVYEVELEDAYVASQNLANRTILAVLKNWLPVQAGIMEKRSIKNITLDTYTPMGYLDVKGKSDKVAMTGVILNVNHIVNWGMCCRQLLQNNNDNGDD